jgi:hypothetical protein
MSPMKRRRFIQTLVCAAPAAAAGVTSSAHAQQPQPPTQSPAGLPVPPAPAAPQVSALVSTVADDVAEPVLTFFTPQQFAGLRRLGAIVQPPSNGNPGAEQALAAEFLDFLLGQSQPERQRIYRSGLDALNAQAKRRFGRHYADLEIAQAEDLLSPLRQPWTYDSPDPLTKFLRIAQQDLRTATQNSLPWAEATGNKRMVNYMRAT